jgi:hypothetical protein
LLSTLTGIILFSLSKQQKIWRDLSPPGLLQVSTNILDATQQ